MANPVPNEYEPAAAAGAHVELRFTRRDGTRHVVLLYARDVPLARRQHVIDGCSPTALAEELETTAAAVRQAKSRVLRRLKQEMGEVLD